MKEPVPPMVLLGFSRIPTIHVPVPSSFEVGATFSLLRLGSPWNPTVIRYKWQPVDTDFFADRKVFLCCSSPLKSTTVLCSFGTYSMTRGPL